MAEKMGPIISTNGLVFCVDAANPQSIVSGQTIWKDLTFNTTGGTLVNGVIFTGTGVSSGLSYDGTDDYISNISGVSTTNQISVNAWIRPRSINNFQHIVDSSSNTWHLAILNTNNVYFWDGFNYHRSGATVNVNTNHMVTGVKNTTTNRIYLNGSLTNSIDSANNIPTNTINIGRWQGATIGGTPGRYFTGTTYGVQVYNRAITPFEVYQNYNAMKGRYGIPDIVTGGLVLNLDAGNPYSYNPDNIGSTVWTDVSYTSSGGTLVNGTSYTGGTLQFDGTDDYVRFRSGLYGRTSFSLECVFYNDSGVVGNDEMFTSDYTPNGNTSNPGVEIYMNGSTIYFRSNYNDSSRPATISYQTNRWNHLVCVCEVDVGIRIYLNGVAGTPNTPTNQYITWNNQFLNLGVITNYSQFLAWKGRIGVGRVYNRALTQTEIQQNFNALRGRYGI